MPCEIRVRKAKVEWSRRRGWAPCGRRSRTFEIRWRGQTLGAFQLCKAHRELIAKKPVDLVKSKRGKRGGGA